MTRAEEAVRRALELRASRRSAEAIDLLLRAVQRESSHAGAAHVLAGLLVESGDAARGAYFAERAASLSRGTPGEAKALTTLGAALQMLERSREALGAYERAVALDPGNAQALNGLGVCAHAERDLTRSLASYEAALRLKPGDAALRRNYAKLLGDCGRAPEAADQYRAALELLPPGPARAETHIQLAMAMNYDPRPAPGEVQAMHLRIGALVGEGSFVPPVFANARDPERRLRVGFLSGDFRLHSVAFFFEPLLGALDRGAFEPVLYSTTDESDRVTERLRSMASGWCVLKGQSDEAATARIRGDGIDVLVDLSGLTNGNRVGVLARRAAPVQCTYLGYANSTGLRHVDARIVDAWTDPPELEGAVPIAERRVRLARTMWAYRPPPIPDGWSAPTPAGDGPVTFGSFNNIAKINRPLLGLWAEVLRRTPGSRLLLKSKGFAGEPGRREVGGTLASLGIEPSRVEMVDWSGSLTDHLAMYGRVDVGLDTYPFHGTTTTCEALWMGVPVVTRVGVAHASRVGLSLLSAVGERVAGGAEDLIAHDDEGYVRAAVALAADAARRRALRGTLRGAVEGSALGDAAGLASAFGGALRELWRGWCGGAAGAGA